jgi:hypothetical protein
MAGVGPADLHTFAEEFLDACVAALDTIPYYTTLDGAPLDAFLTPGSPAYDCCPQLTVHVAPLSEGPSSAPPPLASAFRINHVTLVATLLRCLPPSDTNGNPPTPAAQHAAAEQIHADKWALWNHVWNRMRAGLLFSRCNNVIWNGLTSIQPQGLCGGSILTVTVALDGYEETIGT